MTERTVKLDYLPRPWQRECHQRRKRFTVLALHRRAGKTVFAIMELLDRAMRSTQELCVYGYVAPFRNQAKTIAWARLKKTIEPLRMSGAVEINESELTLTFLHNGAVVRCFGADNANALRGLRLDGVVIDEVAQIAPTVWTDVIRPTLSDRLGWAIFIGTPAGTDLFSQLFYDAETQPDWFAALYTVDDTNALDPDEVVSLRNGGMPENSFAREYLCDFTASGTDQLISLTDADMATKRTYVERDIYLAPRILGVDPARFGDDSSVICKRQGLQVFPLIVHQGIDNMQLAGRVANIINDWQPSAVFIDSGAGAGVIDRLRQLGFSPIEIPFGGKATQSHLFINRRTEMWCGMAEWLRAGGAIPLDATLRRELATPTYSFDSAGRKVLESKDDVKKRLAGGASTDRSDALALTFAAPVASGQFQDAAHRPKSVPIDYDPHNPTRARQDYDPHREFSR